MKSLKLNLITAAATLIVATATASAQSTLNANVPFAFSISSRTMLPAGDYNVVRVGGNAEMWVFEDRETGKKTMVALGQPNQSRPGDPAKLEFQCHSDRCALSKIQVGNSEVGYELHPKVSKAEAEQSALVVVPLTRGNAE
jgi:hypothetical protein